MSELLATIILRFIKAEHLWSLGATLTTWAKRRIEQQRIRQAKRIALKQGHHLPPSPPTDVTATRSHGDFKVTWRNGARAGGVIVFARTVHSHWKPVAWAKSRQNTTTFRDGSNGFSLGNSELVFVRVVALASEGGGATPTGFDSAPSGLAIIHLKENPE